MFANKLRNRLLFFIPSHHPCHHYSGLHFAFFITLLLLLLLLSIFHFHFYRLCSVTGWDALIQLHSTLFTPLQVAAPDERRAKPHTRLGTRQRHPLTFNISTALWQSPAALSPPAPQGPTSWTRVTCSSPPTWPPGQEGGPRSRVCTVPIIPRSSSRDPHFTLHAAAILWEEREGGMSEWNNAGASLWVRERE